MKYLFLIFSLLLFLSCKTKLYGLHDVEIDGTIYDKCEVTLTAKTIHIRNHTLKKEFKITETRYIVLKAGGLMYYYDDKLYEGENK